MQAPIKTILPKAALLILLLAAASCRPSGKPAPADTPILGEISIVCDESYKPLIEVQLDTFHKLYKYARITATYLPESRAFNEVMNNDSMRLLIASRKLNDDENNYFKSRNLFPKTNAIAIDAMALIINQSNADSQLTFDAVKNILTGKTISWKSVNPNSKRDSIKIVFDNNGSANTRYVKELFSLGDQLPANWFAVGGNESLVDYIATNPNAIGIIGMNWISDRDSPEAEKFLSRIRVVAVSPGDSVTQDSDFYKPYQAYVALKKYPFTREVVVINREARNGLGTGFASFMAGDQGQRIVRLMGMLPATMPVRIIKTN